MQYGLEDESWDMLSAVRNTGLSIINLRSQLELTLEVFQSPVKKLIQEVVNQVNDLGVSPRSCNVTLEVNLLIGGGNEAGQLKTSEGVLGYITLEFILLIMEVIGQVNLMIWSESKILTTFF